MVHICYITAAHPVLAALASLAVLTCEQPILVPGHACFTLPLLAVSFPQKPTQLAPLPPAFLDHPI